MDQKTLIMLCSIAAAALVGYFLTKIFVGDEDSNKLRDRLTNDGQDVTEAPRRSVKTLLETVGEVAAHPFMPKTSESQSGIRKGLAEAGIYSASAFRLMAGAKVICLVAGLLLGYLAKALFGHTLLCLSLGGILGYLSPAIWLKLRIGKNQTALTNGLADALDLMVVCVEAGLTVDAAMQRVGQELAIAHPAVSREFGISHMETRVGLSRSQALKNLGERTGNAALQSLATMLIQADRFGTSIAQALRVHSDTLRTQRQQLAEESAAKATVKLSFPLVLFIFPATFIVLVGPTIVNIAHSELMK
ncbi:MAG TPA: type II secretion system F family protein [Tepidisphaeraceae bacterium]|nr:type II secretion system F family protein [Tepidisphaeraceae bacterium]